MSFPGMTGHMRAVVPVSLDREHLFVDAQPGVVRPVLKSVTTWNGTVAVAGDTELVAAPGVGSRLKVSAFVLQNESTTPLIMRLRSGVSSNGWRCLGQNQGDGLAMRFGTDREWELNENEPLNLELSDAETCAISLSYYTESV